MPATAPRGESADSFPGDGSWPCKHCGKRLDSAAKRTKHERSCPENPFVKEHGHPA